MTARLSTMPHARTHRRRFARSVLLAAGALLALLAPSPPRAHGVNFDYYTTQPVLVDTLRALVKIVNYIRNNEATTQIFTVTKAQTMPPYPGWWSSICIGDLCYRPDLNSVNKAVFPGDSVKVSSWIQCDTVATNPGGFGLVALTVMPYETPGEAVTHLLAAITDNVGVLIVDDDGGENYETYSAGALPAGNGKTYGVWPRVSAGPDSAALARFERVIWLTGAASPSLDAADRAALSGHLAVGGKVLLSGQNIASEMCDPALPSYAPEACMWLAEAFHATYAADTAGATSVAGVEDDALGAGLAFAIAGGDGADNQTSPDGIAAAPEGVAFLEFDGTAHAAGVRNCEGPSSTVFLAFGFEGIAGAADRAALMQGVLAFFDQENLLICPAAPDFNEPLAPNKPNPFFPNTELTIRLAEPGSATLGIYDTAGRLVRTLFDGPVAAGETPVVWDGRSDDGEDLPSGIYFARLVAPNKEATRKLNLVR